MSDFKVGDRVRRTSGVSGIGTITAVGEHNVLVMEGGTEDRWCKSLCDVVPPLLTPPEGHPMSTISDGGPAFPSGLRHSHNESEPDDCYATDPGMSLRDYFASNVSPQEIEWYVPTDVTGCRKFLKLPENEPWTNSSHMKIVQIIKYRIADAMLKAREANNECD